MGTSKNSPLDSLVKPLGYNSYTEYLNGDHWKIFSNSVRAEMCSECGSRRSLQVHHKTYKRLGAELASDVTTLCATCHMKAHDSASPERKRHRREATILNLKLSEFASIGHCERILDLAGIVTYRDLVSKTEEELRLLPRIGDVAISKIKQSLSQFGLKLKGDS